MKKVITKYDNNNNENKYYDNHNNSKDNNVYNDDIIIVNPVIFNKKKSNLKKDGKKFLHVVSDYDNTLTCACFDGKKIKSTFAQLRSGGYLPKEYEEKSWNMFHHYFPIERSSTISLKEKSKKMTEWWTKHMELLKEYKLNKKTLIEVARNIETNQRDGTFKFYDLLNKNNIPLLIFSAGQGDIIEEFLRYSKKLTKNIHIISNYYNFDNDGFLLGFSGKIIHPFNKNEQSINNTFYSKEIKSRKNVILLGDSLGDPNMCDGIKHDNIIKIGFLNFEINEKLEEYKKHYDVLILNDGSINYVIELIQEIIN